MEKQTLRELWAHGLKDLWDVEQEMRNALPDASASQDDEVRQVFKSHQAKAEGHLERLREIFVAGAVADRSQGRPAPKPRRPTRRAKRSSRGTLSAGA